VEVAASSASYDLHVKREVYRRNGVREYVVWRVYDRQVDWFRLENGQYVPVPADAAGMIHSRTFPGLRLAVPALLSGDLAHVLVELQQGPGVSRAPGFCRGIGRSNSQVKFCAKVNGYRNFHGAEVNIRAPHRAHQKKWDFP